MTLKSLFCMLKQAPADQPRMGITNDDPVFLLVGHQPGSMYTIPVYGLAVNDLVEPAVSAPVPDHVSCVDGIDQDSPYGRTGPFTAVDV